MKTRLSLHFAAVIAALAGAALALPSLASAQIVELGQTKTPVVAPVCQPGSLSSCKILLTRTTAVQESSDGVINPTRVNQPGWIVAYTVGLSRLSSNRRTEATLIKDADASYGGAPELALTVLRPGPRNTFTVEGETPLYPMLPFLGQVLQEPLSPSPTFSTFTALRVLRGEVVGLTVPTWAPVLDYYVSPTLFSYRQSRRANCKNPAAGQTAQAQRNDTGTYGCYYTGTRVEYSATEIADVSAPKTYVGQSRR